MKYVKADQKNLVHLPAPRFRDVRDAQTGKNCYKFFEYWLSVPEDALEYVEVRVYRVWPTYAIKQLPDHERPKTVERDMMTGKAPFEDPHAYEEWFLENYKSGGWLVMLNELGVKGYVMKANFSAVDLDNFPVEMDLRTLVMGVPENDSFTQWLRRQNLDVPEFRTPEQKAADEDDMGTNDALKTVTDLATDAMKQNAQLSREKSEAEIASLRASVPQANDIATATTESIRLVTGTAKSMVDMVTANAGNQFNPIELMRAAAEMTSGKDKQGDRTTDMMGLLVNTIQAGNAAASAATQRQIEFMEKTFHERILAERVPPPAPPPPKSLQEQVGELKTVADLFGIKLGRTSEDKAAPAAAAEPAKPGFWELAFQHSAPFLEYLGTVTILGANAWYNHKNPQTPIAPGQAMSQAGKPLSQQQAAHVQQQNAQQQAQPQGQQAQQQQAGPLTQQQQAQQRAQEAVHAAMDQGIPPEVAQWAGFLQEVEGGMLAHFYGDESSLDGRTFAQWIKSSMTGGPTTERGRIIYAQIKDGLGPKGFDSLCRANHSIWSKVGGMKPRYDKFVQDFFTYDEYLNGSLGGDDDDDDDATPPEAGAAGATSTTEPQAATAA